jgi:hypothetical protein
MIPVLDYWGESSRFSSGALQTSWGDSTPLSAMLYFMLSLPMKEIHIPAQLDREERERRGFKPPKSLGGVFLRASFVAILGAVMSFFVLTALSIATLAIFGVVSHRIPNFPNAYRYVGAPGAIVVFFAVWIYAFVVFRRQMKAR